MFRRQPIKIHNELIYMQIIKIKSARTCPAGVRGCKTPGGPKGLDAPEARPLLLPSPWAALLSARHLFEITMPNSQMSQTQRAQAIEANLGCTDQDLSGFDFERIGGEDELDFTGCRITGTRIKGDALIASRWVNCQFLDCTFAMTDLREAQFTNCSFYNTAEVRGAVFQHCNLNRTAFTDCDLTLTRFKGCDAYDIAFSGCQMRGTDFDGSNFSQTMGRRALTAARFTDCRLTDALLNRLDLNGCHFTDCDMTGTALNGARLVNAVLRDCALIGPELLQADLSGADLGGSRLEGVNLPELRSYAAMTVSASQQHILLQSLGIEVTPD